MGLRRALQINPNGLAIVCGDRRQTWRRSRRPRGAPRRRASARSAPETGDRVAILSLNSDRYLELYLAAGWSGTVIVPLNIRWSPLENEDAMRDCRAEHPVRRQGVCAGRHRAGQGHSRPEAGLCRRRRNARRHGELRDADRAQRADAGRDARRRRSRRHLLHRRHHRPLQGRHAQPRQSDGQRAQCAERGHVSGHRDLSACRADVPSRQWRGDVFDAAERRLERDHPGLYAGRRCRRDAEGARHPRAAGADHDPDVRRSAVAVLLRPVVAEEHRLRRLPDQRGRARPRDEGPAQCASSRRPTA